MKVNCRACDICGEELGGRDFQYWLRKELLHVSWRSAADGEAEAGKAV